MTGYWEQGITKGLGKEFMQFPHSIEEGSSQRTNALSCRHRYRKRSLENIKNLCDTDTR